MNRLWLQVFSLTVLISSAALVQAADDKALPPAEPKPAEAKAQPAVRPGALAIAVAPSGPLRWARMPNVQEELKLSDEQKTAVNEAIQELGAANREMSQALRGNTADERAKKAPEVEKKFADARAEIEKKVQQALKPEQVTRLQQIDVQARGLRGLTQDDIAGKLKLTDEQRKKIADLQAEQQQKVRQLAQDVRNGNVERAKYREKLDELSKEHEKDTMDVLTDEQQAEYEKMKGEKFELGRRAFGAIQAVPVQPGQIRRIQIQPGKIQIQPKAVPLPLEKRKVEKPDAESKDSGE